MPQTDLKYGVVGAGGLGREVAALLQYMGLPVSGFWDDGLEPGILINGLPIFGKIDQADPKITPNLVLAIAHPQTRYKLATFLKNKGFLFPAVQGAPQLVLSTFVRWGCGTIVFPGTVATANVEVGDFSIVHANSFLGHDTKVGDFCTLMPGCMVSGGSHLENMVYAGTASRFIKPVTVPAKSRIPAGSIVDEHFEFNAKILG